MTVSIPNTETGQTILSHLVITTATAALLTGGAVGLNLPGSSLVKFQSGSSIFSDLKDYERAIRGFDSSGSDSGFSDHAQEIAILVGFAEKMLANMSDVPAEYEKIFQENFKDILA